MAFIEYIPPEAQPSEDRVGDNDHILQIHSVHSKLLKLHYNLYKELMFSKGPLSRIQREMIAVVVSAENECHYWIQHHGAGLRRLLSAKKVPKDEQDTLLEHLVRNRTANTLDKADLSLLKYVIKLTRTPAHMTKADTDELRTNGYDDRGIHDICAITAYFAFVNRMADGLGVELENRFSE